MLKKALIATLTVFASLAAVAAAGGPAQSTIALPDEFRPEGIASGSGSSF